MDHAAALQHIRLAAATAQASTSTADQRNEAERVLLNFSESDSPFDLSKVILEQGDADSAAYWAITAVQNCIMRKWGSLDGDFVDGWRAYLLAYVTNKIATTNGFPAYICHRALQTIALMLKRGWLDPRGARSRAELFAQIWSFVNGSNVRLQAVACRLLLEITVQMAASPKSSDVGLTWEFHDQCKRSFEQNELRAIFEASANVLRSAVAGAVHPSAASAFVAMAEHVLTWEFATGRARRVGTFTESTGSGIVPFRPPDSWRQLVLSPDLVAVFFSLHAAMRAANTAVDDEAYMHCARCIVQLCSIAGACVDSEEFAVAYVRALVPLAAQAVTARPLASLPGRELLWIGQLSSTLLSAQPLRRLMAAGAGHLDAILMSMSAGACACLDPSVQFDDEEATWRAEALDHFLAGFVSLRNGAHAEPSTRATADEQLRPYVGPVFEAYLSWRATRRGGDGEGSLAGEFEEMCVDVDSDDWDVYEDQLRDVGCIARADAGRSIAQLLAAIGARSARISAWVSGGLSADERTALFEELYWIFIVAGNVVADASDGEKPSVPDEMLQLSLTSGGDPARDPIAALSQELLRLAEAEAIVIARGDMSQGSPRLARSIVWLLRRWGSTYLMLEEDARSTQSPSLAVAYGSDSPSGAAVLEFIAKKAAQNVIAWRGEPEVCRDSADLLLALARSSQPARRALGASPSVRELARMLGEPRSALRDLPGKSQCNVVRAVSSIAFEGGFLGDILQVLSQRYLAVIGAPEFSKRSQDPAVISELTSCLEGMRGVALAACTSAMAPVVFAFLLPHLPTFPTLMGLYSNCADVYAHIVDLVVDAVGSLISLVSDGDCVPLYVCALRLLETHQRNIAGRASAAPGEEDERHEDLVRLLKLLTNIIRREFADFAPGEGGGEMRVHAAEGITQVSDVVLYGLGMLLPLLSGEILRYPDLPDMFYSLVEFVCDFYPDRVASMHAVFLQQFASALAEGLGADATNVEQQCLCAIAELAAHRHSIVSGTCRTQATPDVLEGQARALDGFLPHFLAGIVNMLLHQRFDMGLIEPSSEALFALICSYPQHFSELAGGHVSGVADDALRARFEVACRTLMSANGVEGVLNRTNKAKFKKNLEAFLMDVRGFLRRK